MQRDERTKFGRVVAILQSNLLPVIRHYTYRGTLACTRRPASELSVLSATGNITANVIIGVAPVAPVKRKLNSHS